MGPRGPETYFKKNVNFWRTCFCQERFVFLDRSFVGLVFYRIWPLQRCSKGKASCHRMNHKQSDHPTLNPFVWIGMWGYQMSEKGSSLFNSGTYTKRSTCPPRRWLYMQKRSSRSEAFLPGHWYFAQIKPDASLASMGWSLLYTDSLEATRSHLRLKFRVHIMDPCDGM